MQLTCVRLPGARPKSLSPCNSECPLNAAERRSVMRIKWRHLRGPRNAGLAGVSSPVQISAAARRGYLVPAAGRPAAAGAGSASGSFMFPSLHRCENLLAVLGSGPHLLAARPVWHASSPGHQRALAQHASGAVNALPFAPFRSACSSFFLAPLLLLPRK